MTSAPLPEALQSLLLRGRPGKLRLSQIIPWDENPRAHSPEQIRLLKKSIESHGFGAPLLLQDGSNKLVAGHGRRIAVAELAAGADPELPVVWLPLTDEQAASYAIADNRLTDLSEWNMPALRGLLAELDNGAWEMEATGFTSDDLNGIFGVGGPKSNLRPGVDPDAAPPLPAEPVTQPGDLYLLGSSRLLCGDSTRPEDWARLMEGRVADLVITDPPYGVAYESSAADLKAGGKASIKNDALQGEAFQTFLDATFRCLAAVTAKRAAF